MSIKLYHREFEGAGKPCIIVHGLLGSSRNWLTAGKALGAKFKPYAVDLRNHGMSPHVKSMAYSEMAKDLLEWMDSQQLDKVILMGHSMGGKVCMQLAVDYPERVEGLIVVDISNRAYKPRWEKEFEAMRALDLQSLKSRGEAEKELEPVVSDWAFRKFLCSNLERESENSGFKWAINLDIIYECLTDLFQSVPKTNKTYVGPSLFISGEKSNFLNEAEMGGILNHFPKAELRTVPDAGHNVHFDNLQGFLQALEGFAEE